MTTKFSRVFSRNRSPDDAAAGDDGVAGVSPMPSPSPELESSDNKARGKSAGDGGDGGGGGSTIEPLSVAVGRANTTAWNEKEWFIPHQDVSSTSSSTSSEDSGHEINNEYQEFLAAKMHSLHEEAQVQRWGSASPDSAAAAGAAMLRESGDGSVENYSMRSNGSAGTRVLDADGDVVSLLALSERGRAAGVDPKRRSRLSAIVSTGGDGSSGVQEDVSLHLQMLEAQREQEQREQFYRDVAELYLRAIRFDAPLSFTDEALRMLHAAAPLRSESTSEAAVSARHQQRRSEMLPALAISDRVRMPGETGMRRTHGSTGQLQLLEQQARELDQQLLAYVAERFLLAIDLHGPMDRDSLLAEKHPPEARRPARAGLVGAAARTAAAHDVYDAARLLAQGSADRRAETDDGNASLPAGEGASRGKKSKRRHRTRRSANVDGDAAVARTIAAKEAARAAAELMIEQEEQDSAVARTVATPTDAETVRQFDELRLNVVQRNAVIARRHLHDAIMGIARKIPHISAALDGVFGDDGVAARSPEAAAVGGERAEYSAKPRKLNGSPQRVVVRAQQYLRALEDVARGQPSEATVTLFSVRDRRGLPPPTPGIAEGSAVVGSSKSKQRAQLMLRRRTRFALPNAKRCFATCSVIAYTSSRVRALDGRKTDGMTDSDFGFDSSDTRRSGTLTMSTGDLQVRSGGGARSVDTLTLSAGALIGPSVAGTPSGADAGAVGGSGAVGSTSAVTSGAPGEESTSLRAFLAPSYVSSIYRKAQQPVLATFYGAPTEYSPFFLDDPKLRTGKHRTVLNLRGMKSSVLPFVRKKDLKAELNDVFRQRHAWLPAPALTLSRLRKVKRAVLDVLLECDLELSTAAFCYVYLDKLILAQCVTKRNVRMKAATCLILACKFSDPAVAESEEGTDQSVVRRLVRCIQKRMELSMSNSVLCREELETLCQLKLQLYVPLAEVFPHFQLLHAQLDIVDDDYFYTKFAK